MAAGLPVDQAIIYEDTGHIHVSHTIRQDNRREVRVHVIDATLYGTEYPLWEDYNGPLKEMQCPT